jgi:hypothetical protein
MPFSATICNQLNRRVGGACSICHAPTTGPHTDPAKSTSVGEGAHIHGEKVGAARYNGELPETEIASAENGIWLCRSCHTRVDSDEERYTADYLRAAKTSAERNADLVLGVPWATGIPAAIGGSVPEGMGNAGPGIANAGATPVTVMLDADVKYLADRVTAFPAQERLVHLNG